MTDTDRIAEIEQVLHGLNTPPPSVERVRARQNLLEHGLSYLSYLLDRLKSEREARQQFISDVSEGMECLPGCDSHGHEEGCPVADPMAAFRNLRENLQRAEPQPAPETPAPLRVRISSHHGSSSWYAGHEGEAFEVVDNGVSYYTLKEDYDRGHDHMWRHIPKYHCEVLPPETPELGGSSR